MYICVSAPGSWIAAIRLGLDQEAQSLVSYTGGAGLMVEDPAGPLPVQGSWPLKDVIKIQNSPKKVKLVIVRASEIYNLIGLYQGS